MRIPLSEAEQASFFARWGNDIQNLISNGFGQVQKALNRILFLQEANQPLLHFTCVFGLNREYTGSEIGHFRAFAWVHLKGPSVGLLSFIFGATDNSNRLNIQDPKQLKGPSGISTSMCGGQWEVTMPESPQQGDTTITGPSGPYNYVLSGSFRSVGLNKVNGLAVRYGRDTLFRFTPQPKLLDINDCMFLFYLNRRLADKLRSIRIYANEYKLAEILNEGFMIDQSSSRPEIPLVSTDEELTDPWIRLRPKNQTTFFKVSFSEQTPKRLFDANEI